MTKERNKLHGLRLSQDFLLSPDNDISQVNAY